VLTVFPCYAMEDRQVARDLTEFLERGSGVQIFLKDGELGPGETLVSKAADGLQAFVILLILSPDSVPGPWILSQWEPVLIDEPKRAGVKTATVLVRSCEFPRRLRRESFFDLTQDRLGEFRKIKRWLLRLGQGRPAMEFEPARQKPFDSQDVELENLRQALADQPGRFVLAGAGKTAVAIEFARQSKRDFEGLVWLSCAGQTIAALAGEMASELGMTLDGDLETNLRELGRFCTERRLLVILDEPPEEAERLIPGERSSALLVRTEIETATEDLASLDVDQRKLLAAAYACGKVPFRLPLVSEIAGVDVETAGRALDEIVARGLVTQLDVRSLRYITKGSARDQALARAHARAVCGLFASWAVEESQCEAEVPQLRRALDWAISQPDGEAWALACDLAKRGVSLLKRKRRQAEAFEMLESVARAAEGREDRHTLEDCSREQVWILESWGRMDEAQRIFHEHRALYEDQMQLNFE
jgi:hypothetical protein